MIRKRVGLVVSEISLFHAESSDILLEIGVDSDTAQEGPERDVTRARPFGLECCA